MYSRDTELRHLRPNDIYNLAVRLDDNNCWKKLMEIIPKELNAQTSSAENGLSGEQAIGSAGRKYNNDHIRLIEEAIKRPGESRLYSQILFDEWGTSGRKHERPTLGVLLQLLVKAELFRAADFVATNFLNEPEPERPRDGPAARIDISLSDEIFNDIEDFVNDSSFYPGTASLNDNAKYANSVPDNNKDFYSKYQRIEKNVIFEEDSPPKPPPRALRTARLQMQQQQKQLRDQLQLAAIEASTAMVGNSSSKYEYEQQRSLENGLMSENIPKFSTLMTKASDTQNSSANYCGQTQNTESTNLSEAPIPMISILAHRSAKATETLPEETSSMTDNEILPVISALNLNGERDFGQAFHQSQATNDTANLSRNSDLTSSLSNSDSEDDNIEDSELPAVINKDEEDDDNCDVDSDNDCSIPNLSLLDQQSSNNDSSLTNITGTSGENSFDQSLNDSSSASNENIPCLSALKQ